MASRTHLGDLSGCRVWPAVWAGRGTQVGLTVAVTGPTGEIGISAVTALEREPTVDKIIGMARRPFDPSPHAWSLRYCRPSRRKMRASAPQSIVRVIVRSAHDFARGTRTG